jgi:hypothetical protein
VGAADRKTPISKTYALIARTERGNVRRVQVHQTTEFCRTFYR